MLRIKVLKNHQLQIKTKNWVITYWIKTPVNDSYILRIRVEAEFPKKHFRIIGPNEIFCLCLKSNPTYHLIIIECGIVWDSGKEKFRR